MSWTTGTQAEVLGGSSAVGSAYASATAATAVSPVSGAGYLPANFFLPTYGLAKRLRVRAYGVLGTTSTPNLTVGLTGNTTLGTYNSGAILATSAVVAQASSVTNVPWELDVALTCSAVGGSGSILAMGKFVVYTASTTVQTMRVSSSTANPNTAATLATTSAYYLEMFATWGTNNASNTFQVYDYEVMGLN